MRHGMQNVKAITKRTFDKQKMQGAKLLSRELFISETGVYVTAEVIIN